MSELDEFELPFWSIILIICLIICCIFSCCTAFVICCFYPENSKGPSWEHNTEGSRWVRGFSWVHNWLAYETEECQHLDELKPNQVCPNKPAPKTVKV